MPLPTFLIIGAMKAGTTTLYRDLLSNPDISFARDKEVGSLVYDDVLSEGGKRRYEEFFEVAGPARAVGDASTDYAKLPDKPGVPGRALKVLGPRLKIVYMVRDPIPRLLSQHHFEYQRGWVGGDVDRAIVEEPRFLAYSKYGMQLEPWYEAFRPKQIQIVHFEEYIANRAATVTEVSCFLGVMPRSDLIDSGTNYNPTVGAPVVRGAWASLSRNALYRRAVRPFLSVECRRQIRLNLLRNNRLPPPNPPSARTLAYLREELGQDLARFYDLTGETSPSIEGGAASDRAQ